MDFGQFCVMFRSIFWKDLPALGRRAIDPEEPGAAFSRPGRRIAIAVRRRAHSRSRTGERCGVVLDNGEQIGSTQRAVVGWDRGDDAAVRRSDRCRDQFAGPDVVYRDDFGAGSVAQCSWGTSRRSCSSTTPNNSIGSGRATRFVIRAPVSSARRTTFSTTTRLLRDGVMRVTLMADHDRWCALPEEEYRLAKLHWYDRDVEKVARICARLSAPRDRYGHVHAAHHSPFHLA